MLQVVSMCLYDINSIYDSAASRVNTTGSNYAILLCTDMISEWSQRARKAKMARIRRRINQASYTIEKSVFRNESARISAD